jgi:hypothetical protein
MKWPSLSAHSRASLADALATITPALTRDAPGRPPAAALRAALYAWSRPTCYRRPQNAISIARVSSRWKLGVGFSLIKKLL